MYDFNDESEANFNQLKKNYSKLAIIQAKRKQERYFTNLGLLLIFILVAASYYLLEHHPESISLDKALLALGITWLGFLPSIQYLLDRKRSPIPFFPLVGIFYATSFGLPMFSRDLELSGRSSITNVSVQALILVLLGILGMNISFYFSKSSLWHKISSIQISVSSSQSSQRKLLIFLWLALLLHLAAYYIPSIGKIPSLGQLLGPLGYVAYGLFYILWVRRQLSSIQTWIFFGICLPIELIQRLISGALADVMTLGLFMTLVIWYERKKIPFVLISIALLFFMIFNPLKIEYRYLTWGGKFSHANPIEKIQLFADLAIKHYSNFGLQSEDGGSHHSTKNTSLERVAHILLFSNVFDDTPTIVPYWSGLTYANLFTSYIPRAVWPDKPVELIGNEFGRRYKFLASNDYSTSWNLPWIVEMYINFGNLGVLIGMPLVGSLLAFFEQKLNSTVMNSLEVVIGATILFPLIEQESNFSLMIGSAVNMSVALFFVFRFILGGKSRQS